MPHAHRIRLNGGWTVTPRPDGGTRHARRFGSPRALDPSEAVFLVCAGLPAAAVTLNGTPLGTADGGFAFDITTRLQPRNEVWIDTGEGGALGEVAVEFRAAGG